MSKSNKQLFDAATSHCQDDNSSRLAKLIMSMTNSGLPKLDKESISSLKSICRQSDDLVREAYRMLISQLETEHSEVRLSSVQIIDELFNRSHCFRELLLADFQTFMELTMETDVRNPLPPPDKVAIELKMQTIGFVKKWHEKFKEGYKLLDLGYNFLKSCKRIDFTDIGAANLVERRRQEDLTTRREAQYRVRKEKVLEEMNDLTPDMHTCVREIESCLTLLLPHPEEFHVDYDHKKSLKDGGRRVKSSKKSSTELSASRIEEPEKYEDDRDRTVSEAELCDEKQHQQHSKDCMADDIENKNIKQEQKDNVNKNDSTNTNSNKTMQCSRRNSRTKDLLNNNNQNTTCRNNDSLDNVVESPSCFYDEEPGTSDENRRHHGVNSRNVNIQVDVLKKVKIHESDNNTDILRTLLDQVSLINNKFLPAVKNWIDILTRSHADQSQIRSALDVRSLINNVMSKVNTLDIIHREDSNKHESIETEPKQTNDSDSDSDDDDDDFIEVKCHDWTELHLRHSVPGCGESSSSCSTKLLPASSTNQTAASASNDISHGEEKSEEGCSQERQKQKAPVVSFGSDLRYWEGEFEVPMLRRLIDVLVCALCRDDSEYRKWWSGEAGEDAVDKNALSEMKNRVIEYSGTFDPVKWKCRALLSTGGLCQRMDRKKCPFHGPIVARDDAGLPIDAELRVKEIEKRMSASNTGGVAWDDPDIQAEISAATGVDITTKKDKKKKKKSGLTDLSSLKKDTPRKRLENKVLNSATLKRVASTMNELEIKRHHAKFFHNYNYTFTE